jgi:hypothetical protein
MFLAPSLNLPLLQATFAETIDQGWQFSADFLSTGTPDPTTLASVSFGNNYLPFNGLAFKPQTADWNGSSVLSLTGVDSMTASLEDPAVLPTASAGAVSTCAQVLADALPTTGSAPPYGCFYPAGDNLRKVDILTGYVTDFGSAWRADASAFQLFTMAAGAGGAVVLRKEVVLDLQLQRRYAGAVYPRLQCSCSPGSAITVENTAETVQILKKLTNPNAPDEVLSIDGQGTPIPPNLAPGEAAAAHLRFPSDVMICPWLKTLVRQYVPIAVPYYSQAVRVTVAEAAKYRCTEIAAAAEGWELDFFPIANPAAPVQPAPDAHGTIIFDRAGQTHDVPQGEYFCRVQRDITVSSGQAVEFPHAPGVAVKVLPVLAIEAPSYVMPGGESDANVYSSAAYLFLPDGSFPDAAGIAAALKAKNEIDLYTAEASIMLPEGGQWAIPRVGQRTTIQTQYGSFTGICIQTQISLSASAQSCRVTVSLPVS